MSVAIAPPSGRTGNVVGDAWVVARRGLLHMRRQPEALADVTLQPVMFVLLFAYVFGGAIQVSNGGYREFLMGGIFAQTIVFGAFGVAIALAYDRSNGAIDRFRSLPMARGAVLGGHAVASLIRGLLPIVLMSLCGLVVGWRIHTSALDALGGYALMIAFSFAVIWLGVLLGSLLPTPEAVQGVAFVVLFPVTFIASTFVPVGTLPGVLRTIAEWNPVTAMSEALRELFGNPQGDFGADPPWPLEHPAAYSLTGSPPSSRSARRWRSARTSGPSHADSASVVAREPLRKLAQRVPARVGLHHDAPAVHAVAVGAAGRAEPGAVLAAEDRGGHRLRDRVAHPAGDVEAQALHVGGVEVLVEGRVGRAALGGELLAHDRQPGARLLEAAPARSHQLDLGAQGQVHARQ